MTATRTRRPNRFDNPETAGREGEIRLSTICTLSGRWNMITERQPTREFTKGDQNGALREIEIALAELLGQDRDTVHAALVQGVL